VGGSCQNRLFALLCFVLSANLGLGGPFRLYGENEAIGAAILTKQLGPNTTAVSEAEEEIYSELVKLNDGFERFDGYVAFAKIENGSSV